MPLYSGIVIHQAITGGFRFRTIDEIAEAKRQVEDRDGQTTPDFEEKGKTDVYVERI